MIEHAGRHRVVLGLADQVGGDEPGVGRVVGDDGDLGGSGLAVDRHGALQVALGRGDVDVAGAGDEVDRLDRAAGGGGPVRQHRECLGAADGVDLVDAEDRARGQDRRVRQAVLVGLRRRGERDGADAGDLGGYRVHHHRADQRRKATRHVQPDPSHRHDAAFHRGAVGHLGDDGLLELGRTGATQSLDGRLESGADVGVERVGGSRQLGGVDPQRRGPHPVEAFAVLETRPPRRVDVRPRTRARPRRARAPRRAGRAEAPRRRGADRVVGSRP